MSRRDLEHGSLLRVAGPIGVLIGAMLLSPVGDIRSSRGLAVAFAMTSPMAAVLDLLAGQLLLLAGAVTWLAGMRARIGLLAVLAGVAWFGPDLFAQLRSDPLLRAFGRFWLSPFLWPLLAHLGLAVVGLDRGRAWRATIIAGYLLAGMVAVGTSATYDWMYDVWCYDTDCGFRNPLLLSTGPGLVRTWRLAGAVLPGLTAVLAASAALAWFRGPRGGAARIGVVWALATVGAAASVRAILIVVLPRDDLGLEAWRWSWALLGLSVLSFGVALAATAIDTWRRTDRMRRIADTLEAAPPPGALQAALREATHDRTLRIEYRLDGDGLVTTDGAPARPGGGEGRGVTPVERDGVRLAVIDHASLVDGATLASTFTAAVLVALDNERLRAAQLAQLRELRESRARIVAVGDAERRRLERDLHDGVQQQLLSALFDIRLARLAAERAGDAERAGSLTEAEALAQTAVDELRRTAHGIHPAVLSRSGLVEALRSLAEEAPLPVDLAAEPMGRLPDAVEAAAYQVVAEAVSGASLAGAASVAVEVDRADETLRLRVRQDGGALSMAVPLRTADRVGAAGGEASWEALPAGGTLLRVELPCA